MYILEISTISRRAWHGYFEVEDARSFISSRILTDVKAVGGCFQYAVWIFSRGASQLASATFSSHRPGS